MQMVIQSSMSTQKEQSGGAVGFGLLKAHGGWTNGIDKTKKRSKEKYQDSSFCGKTKTHNCAFAKVSPHSAG